MNAWLCIEYHSFAIMNAMKTIIDSAGRIVVPKSLRQALNIKPGQVLDIRAGDGRLEIEITATPMTLNKRGKDVVRSRTSNCPFSLPTRCVRPWSTFGGESGRWS